MNSFCCLLAIAYLGAIAMAQDYCKMPCNGVKHIACGNSEDNFGPACAANTRYFVLYTIQPDILKNFNDKRNALAGGQIPNHSTASRMATLQWDYELAKMASMNAVTCKGQHDSCHTTENFKGSGQTIGRISWTGTWRPTSELVATMIDTWWAENKSSNIENFAIMGADKNPRVGCGAIVMTNGNSNIFDLTCNWATTNDAKSPVYVSGPATSQCTTGRNPSYPNLCSVDEVYAGL